MTESTDTINDPSLIKTAIAALLATFGASLCCVGPLILISLGIGGTWISYLTAVEPYRPIFILLALFFLILAFRKLYLVARICTPGTVCAKSTTLQNQRIIFWVVTIILIALMTFPWYGAVFFE